MKKMIGFTKTFIQRSNNFKTPGLSGHDKMSMAGSEAVSCRPEAVLKVDPFTVTISEF